MSFLHRRKKDHIYLCPVHSLAVQPALAESWLRATQTSLSSNTASITMEPTSRTMGLTKASTYHLPIRHATAGKELMLSHRLDRQLAWRLECPESVPRGGISRLKVKVVKGL